MFKNQGKSPDPTEPAKVPLRLRKWRASASWLLGTLRNYCDSTLFLLPILFLSVQSLKAENNCATAYLLAKRAAPLLGLEQTPALKCAILPPDQFEQRLRSSTLHRIQQNRLSGEELAFKLIGFLPFSIDYASCFRKSSLEDINSFFELNSREVLLRQGASLSQLGLLSESIIALRDQEFMLSRIIDSAKTTDSALAADALIQGDLAASLQQAVGANIISTDSSTPRTKPADSCSWPAPFNDLLYFPLDWGPIFAAHLRQNGDRPSNSRAFLNPPRTSRDIIHSAQFIAHGPFAALSAAELQKQAHTVNGRQIFHDTLGQFSVQALLKHYSSAANGILAAKGWRGDSLDVFKLPGTPTRYLARWAIAFESPQDLEEITEAFRIYSRTRFGVEIAPGGTRWQSQAADGSSFSIRSIDTPFPMVELRFQ